MLSSFMDSRVFGKQARPFTPQGNDRLSQDAWLLPACLYATQLF